MRRAHAVVGDARRLECGIVCSTRPDSSTIFVSPVPRHRLDEPGGFEIGASASLRVRLRGRRVRSAGATAAPRHAGQQPVHGTPY